MYDNHNSPNGVYPPQSNTPRPGSWEYTGSGWHMTPGTPEPQKPPEKPERPKRHTGRKVLGAIALVLACGVFGFGGGMAALSLYGGSQAPTVVYKAPEGDDTNTGTTSVGNNENLPAVSEIAASAGQSVVSITTENIQRDYFFGDQVLEGAGSGVIISEDGTIITNNHVVEGANSITVTLPDGSEYPATLVGRDSQTDIAVLKINVTGLTPAVIGNSDALRVGEFVMAIGNPLGTLGGTVTTGIVSALDREVTIDGTTMTLLQMSAAVSPGNSGGGLFNAKGELIAVVNAKKGGDNIEGLGFAIPVNTAMSVADELISNGYVTGRPGLGVNVLNISNPSQASQFGIDLDEPGLYITVVSAGSAAEKAGLQPWDRIASVDGVETNTSDDLKAVLADKNVGDELPMTISRGGILMNVVVVLGELQVS